MSSRAGISPSNYNKTGQICEAILGLHTLPRAQTESRVNVHLQKGAQHSSFLEPLNRERGSEPSAPVKPELCMEHFLQLPVGTGNTAPTPETFPSLPKDNFC